MIDISNEIVAGEQELREIVDCPFCGGSSYAVVTQPDVSDYGRSLNPPFRDMQFQMVRCTGCDTVYQRNRPRADELGRYYSTGDYHCYESLLSRGAFIRAAAIGSAKKVVRDIDAHRPHRTDTVVDFGCGSGSWIELFKLVAVKWNLIGTEILPELCKAAEQAGGKCVVADHGNIDSVSRARVRRCAVHAPRD